MKKWRNRCFKLFSSSLRDDSFLFTPKVIYNEFKKPLLKRLLWCFILKNKTKKAKEEYEYPFDF